MLITIKARLKWMNNYTNFVNIDDFAGSVLNYGLDYIDTLIIDRGIKSYMHKLTSYLFSRSFEIRNLLRWLH